MCAGIHFFGFFVTVVETIKVWLVFYDNERLWLRGMLDPLNTHAVVGLNCCFFPPQQ